MIITIKFMYNKEVIQQEFETNATVGDLKTFVQENHLILPQNQKIIFQGKVLRDTSQKIIQILQNAISNKSVKKNLLQGAFIVMGKQTNAELEIHIDDIITHVFTFLSLNDICNCRCVSKSWFNLAVTGSSRNLDRYLFVNSYSCYDLLLYKTAYTLPTPIFSTSIDIEYIQHEDFRMYINHNESTMNDDDDDDDDDKSVFTGYPYVFSYNVLSNEIISGMNSDVITCIDVPTGSFIWNTSFEQLKPNSIEKPVTKKLKKIQESDQIMISPQQDNNDDDSDDIDNDENDENGNINMNISTASSSHSTIPALRRYKLLEKRFMNYKKLVSIDYDKKMHRAFIQYDSFLCSVNGSNGVRLNYFDPNDVSYEEKENYPEGFHLDFPCSITNNFILIPAQRILYVLEKRNLQLLKKVKLPSVLNNTIIKEVVVGEEPHFLCFSTLTNHCYLISTNGELVSQFSSPKQFTLRNIVSSGGIYDLDDKKFMENAMRSIILKGSMIYEHKDTGAIIGYYEVKPPTMETPQGSIISEHKKTCLCLNGLHSEYKCSWVNRERKYNIAYKPYTVWTAPMNDGLDYKDMKSISFCIEKEFIYVCYIFHRSNQIESDDEEIVDDIEEKNQEVYTCTCHCISSATGNIQWTCSDILLSSAVTGIKIYCLNGVLFVNLYHKKKKERDIFIISRKGRLMSHFVQKIRDNSDIFLQTIFSR